MSSNSDEEGKVANEPGAGFDSRGLGLKVQKKLLGSMSSKKIAKHFIDDTTASVLDAAYKIIKDYTAKKEAEKVMKYIIKTVIKVGILYRNDQFSEEELSLAESFKKKFHSLAMTMISFHEVEFTYDQVFLRSSVEECRQLLINLISRHLTEKSKTRVNVVFDFFCASEFLDTVFESDSKYNSHLDSICKDMHKMMEEGNL